MFDFIVSANEKVSFLLSPCREIMILNPMLMERLQLTHPLQGGVLNLKKTKKNKIKNKLSLSSTVG